MIRARQACEATGNVYPEMLDTLARAYAENGRLAEAVATAKKACDAAPASLTPQEMQLMFQRLHLYEEALTNQKRGIRPPRRNADTPLTK